MVLMENFRPACAKPHLPKPRAAGRRYGEGRAEPLMNNLEGLIGVSP